MLTRFRLRLVNPGLPIPRALAFLVLPPHIPLVIAAWACAFLGRLGILEVQLFSCICNNLFPAHATFDPYGVLALPHFFLRSQLFFRERPRKRRQCGIIERVGRAARGKRTFRGG